MGRGTLLNADGSVAWEEDWQLNALANEGEAEVLGTYFLGSPAIHANLYLGLSQTTPTAASTLASITESSGGGYARQAIANADWGAVSGTQPGTTTAAQKTFGAASGSDWTAVTYVILATTSSGTGGKLVLYVALSGSTTVHVGQSFLYTLTASAT